MATNQNWQQLISLGIDEAAERLNELTDSPIQVQIPVVTTMEVVDCPQELKEQFGHEPISATELPFTGELVGVAQLLFSQDNALELTAMLTGEEPESPEFDELKQEALTEVGNIVLNSVIGAVSNQLKENLAFSVPTYREEKVEDLLISYTLELETTAVLGNASFTIEQLAIAGEIVLLLKNQLANFNSMGSD